MNIEIELCPFNAEHFQWGIAEACCKESLIVIVVKELCRMAICNGRCRGDGRSREESGTIGKAEILYFGRHSDMPTYTDTCTPHSGDDPLES